MRFGVPSSSISFLFSTSLGKEDFVFWGLLIWLVPPLLRFRED
jgi:hypothetical protein